MTFHDKSAMLRKYRKRLLVQTSVTFISLGFLALLALGQDV